MSPHPNRSNSRCANSAKPIGHWPGPCQALAVGGTHGSEPHMGFGGVKQSGTGWREAGVEALDVYTEWKYVNLIADPAKT